MQVSEKVIRLLVSNYKYCDENDIFKGIVGKELLWVCKGGGFRLRFVKVLAFPTKGTRLYQLAFRDGKTMELRPEDLDRAFVRHERILKLEPVVTNLTEGVTSQALFNLAHMNAAHKEKAMYPPTRSTYKLSAMYGSDFSSSSSHDGDGDGSDDTATTLVALSKGPMTDVRVDNVVAAKLAFRNIWLPFSRNDREVDLGPTAGLEAEDSVMYRAVSKLLEVLFTLDVQGSGKDSVMSLSGK